MKYKNINNELSNLEKSVDSLGYYIANELFGKDSESKEQEGHDSYMSLYDFFNLTPDRIQKINNQIITMSQRLSEIIDDEPPMVTKQA